MYLHVFQWPASGNLVVGGLATDVTNAFLLADPGRPRALRHQGLDWSLAVPATPPDPTDSVVVLECAGAPVGDLARLLSPGVGANVLRAFNAQITGNLQFGFGSKDDDRVVNWNEMKDSISWVVRVNEKCRYQVSINYDPPRVCKLRKVEGDAGKEMAPASQGAAGIYAVQIGKIEFTGPVRQGNQLTDSLGAVDLTPGTYDIQISARDISGQELMRLRKLCLTPVVN